MHPQIAQSLIHHLADRTQRVLGRHSLLQADVAEHRASLLLVSTHATYLTYRLVESLVPAKVHSPFFSSL